MNAPRMLLLGLCAGAFSAGCSAGPDFAESNLHPSTTSEKTGQSAAELQAAAASKLQHIVVIVKENHTFDNFFGSFPGANGITQCPTTSGGTQPCQEAPDKIGHDLNHNHVSALFDWNGGAMNGWSSPAGSDNTGGGTGDGSVYKQYFERDIPNYWKMARSFVLADNFFSNELGPSFPGHLFTVAAQAGWATDNPPTDLTADPLKLLAGFKESPYWGCDEFSGGTFSLFGINIASYAGDTVNVLTNGTASQSSVFPCFNIKAVPDILPAGVTWGFYGTDWSQLGNADVSNAKVPQSFGWLIDTVLDDLIQDTLKDVGHVDEPWSMLDAVNHIRNGPAWSTNMTITGAPWDQNNPVQAAINAGTLPNVTWIVDQDEYSEHPDLNINQYASWINFPLGGVCDGENWTAGYVNMIQNSAYWQNTAIVVTWDDFGGWYDHVAPPRQYGGSAQQPYGLGFRLPLLIVSPYAKPGFVFHEQSEQASVARFIESVFGATTTLSAYDSAAQDGQANNLLDAFNFSQAPLAPQPLTLRDCSSVPNP